jgi:hypothetical protein
MIKSLPTLSENFSKTRSVGAASRERGGFVDHHGLLAQTNMTHFHAQSLIIVRINRLPAKGRIA